MTCSFIGLMISYKYALRPMQIKCFRFALQMLETEIYYSLTPLPEALFRVGKRFENEIGQFFLQVSQLITGKDILTADEAWKQSLNWLKENSFLSESDIDILEKFGYNLGCSDREEQIKHLKLVQQQLLHQEDNAEKEREKNERTWRLMGFWGGLLIVIILC
ncbi:MAG: Stage III sporulation protein AB [Clostridia bacterium 41_269]|nr:MAG: Stage III sporulation protein AB [Clostridia bacterium 41_269]